jgi:hypothetical protein
MHDLDRTLQEFETGGVDALESDAYELEFWSEGEFEGEYDGEFEGEYDGEFEFELEGSGIDVEAVFDEVEEMELAATLLEISDERELDLFLGGLIKKAGKAVGGLIRSPVGKALGGALKNVARKALPLAGAAVGNMLLPGAGGAAGSFLAKSAGKMFGLELEGMSPQDQEFEIARRVVRLAGEATRQAALASNAGNPVTTAKDAVMMAAEIHAPGLVGAAVETARDASRHFGRAARRSARDATGAATGAARSLGSAAERSARDARRNFAGAGGNGGGKAAQGRWVRRGNTIVLLGV